MTCLILSDDTRLGHVVIGGIAISEIIFNCNVLVAMYFLMLNCSIGTRVQGSYVDVVKGFFCVCVCVLYFSH